jgi:hypothetical protein
LELLHGSLGGATEDSVYIDAVTVSDEPLLCVEDVVPTALDLDEWAGHVRLLSRIAWKIAL